MPTILMVEDEAAIATGLAVSLEAEGFTVVWVADGALAVERAQSVAPDLVLLDLMLPNKSGTDICRELRSVSDVPIIIVTAREEEIDRVLGLELGADDYVTKPFSTRELIARIRAVLRRSESSASTPKDVFEAAGVRVDRARHQVWVDGSEVELAPKEFDLLELLVENAGRVLTREILVDRVWGSDYVGDGKTLDVHIRRLRTRVERDPAEPTRITTVRGVGYRFRDRSDAVDQP